MSTMGRPSSYSRDLFELVQNDNRRPEDWQAQAETTPEVFVDDIALLDAAGERVRHVGD
jgi:hypothetical protein